MTTPTRASFTCWQPSGGFVREVVVDKARAEGTSIFFAIGTSPYSPLETFPANNSETGIEAGQTLAQAIYLSGIFYPPPLCSGLGTCGQCRVRILEKTPTPLAGDARFFSAAELGLGWRLGCLHRPVQGMLVVLPPQQPVASMPPALCGSYIPSLSTPKRHPPFLAVDLGTTSLQWLATDGTTQVSGYRVNPQMGAGGDVVSRLAYAGTAEGMGILHELTRKAFLAIMQEARGAGIDPSAIVLAANPAMTAIALGLGLKTARSLGKAPYHLSPELLEAGGKAHTLQGLPSLRAVPALAPFVGGDIAAGYAALTFGAEVPRYPFLLTDMGTNGEILLALAPDKAIIGSVALGPALEGASLAFGSEARPSVVTSFALGPKGLEPVFLAGDASGIATSQAGRRLEGPEPRISGTGYLSLLHRLLLAKSLRLDGSFDAQAPLLARQRAALKTVASRTGLPMPKEPYWPLPGGIYLSASDVEEILKVKAAFSVGLACILREAGLDWCDLSAVYLAGALGRYTDPASLEALGFIPPGGFALVRVAGNTSLAGAVLLGQDASLWPPLDRWAENVTCVHLADDAYFSQNYVANMVFSFRAFQQ